MATPREIRRLAFQALFQLDASEGDVDVVRSWLDGEAARTPGRFRGVEMDRAWSMARSAWDGRRGADDRSRALAPEWPPARQPAVDRAILRLAMHELSATDTDPRIVVNEAVELAKSFSTERSPAFVNGVLAKVVRGDSGASAGVGDAFAARGGEAE